MSNTFTSTQRAAQHTQRLDWLRAHPDLLAQLPGAYDDVEPPQSEALHSAQRQMMHVRLYAPTSRAQVTRWGIRLLVSELRGHGVDYGQRYRS